MKPQRKGFLFRIRKSCPKGSLEGLGRMRGRLQKQQRIHPCWRKGAPPPLPKEQFPLAEREGVAAGV